MTIEQINALLLSDMAGETQSYSDIVITQLRSKVISDLYEAGTPSEEEIEAVLSQEFSAVEMDAEFDLYKAELVAIEEELIAVEAERVRMVDLKDRLDKLSDHNASHSALNPDVANKAVWTRVHILENSDKALAESNMSALESKDAEAKAQRDSVAYIELRKAEYPSIEELVVAIIEDDALALQLLKDKRQVIKLKYPKV